MNKKSKTGTTTGKHSACLLETSLSEQPEIGGEIKFFIGKDLKTMTVDSVVGHMNGLMQVYCSDKKRDDYYELRLVLRKSSGEMKRVERKVYNLMLQKIKDEMSSSTSSS